MEAEIMNYLNQLLYNDYFKISPDLKLNFVIPIHNTIFNFSVL